MPRFLLAAIGLAALVLVGDAQVRPLYDMGAAGLTQVLQRLQTTASVLHTGAHPDDEDSAFIARTARGDHARVAYISLNRGEGGQNIIGPELFALGVIPARSCCRHDGLTALSSSSATFDYGFSKSRAEAVMKWNTRWVTSFASSACSAARRLFPLQRHLPTVMAITRKRLSTPLAYKAAADQAVSPAPRGLRPWQAKSSIAAFGNARPDPAVRPAGAGRNHRSRRRRSYAEFRSRDAASTRRRRKGASSRAGRSRRR
jgi:hypothetical protein